MNGFAGLIDSGTLTDEKHLDADPTHQMYGCAVAFF